MTTRSTAKAVAVALCVLIGNPAFGQDRSPQVTYAPGFKGTYQPGSVTAPNYANSDRVKSLVRAGQIYLSLQDAIALALENSLDVELQRYGLELAKTDTLRAQGGGTLRGISLTVNEIAAGIGGPGSPLITTAATGVTPQSSIPVNISDAQLIQQGQSNLGVTGTLPFSNGPAIPQFDPALQGQFQAQHTSTPQTSLTSTGTQSLNQNIVNTNANYFQGFSLGTQVTAGFQNQYTGTNNEKTIYSPYYNSTLGVTITQPLLRGFGKELNQRFIRIARNSEKVTEAVFRQQVISTVSGVIRLYNDLVSLNEDLNVKKQTLAVAMKLVDDNASKVEQGTLAPIELTRAKAQAAASRQDVFTADGYVRQQELIVKNAIFRSGVSDPSIKQLRIIPTDPIRVDDMPLDNNTDLAGLALENRPEYVAAKLQLINAEISLKGTKNSLLPQLDVVATAQNTGLAGAANANFAATPTSPLPNPVPNTGNWGSALAQVLAHDYPTYSVGINLTLPLRNRTAQADVARDEIQVRQSQIRLKQLENQIRLEVEDALIALNRTKSALEAAAETRKLQEESLAIEQEKFAVGLSTNFLVIQYQGYLAQARSTEVAARSAYVKAKVQLERALGKTLENNNVSIAEAVKGQVSRPPSSLPPTP